MGGCIKGQTAKEGLHPTLSGTLDEKSSPEPLGYG